MMGEGTSMSFGPCRCGHVPEPPSTRRRPWAVLAGFDGCVTLQDPDGSPAAALPETGSTALVELRYPFTATAGAPFWASYDPLLAGYNGYDQHPGDLAGFRMVRLRIAGPLTADPRSRSAVAQATVLAALGPADLLASPPNHGALGDTLDVVLPRTAVARCGSLCRIDAGFEGDIGYWLLLSEDRAGTSLLAYGAWGPHENEVFAGHRPLAPAERDVIAPVLDDAPPAAREGRRAIP